MAELAPWERPPDAALEAERAPWDPPAAAEEPPTQEPGEWLTEGQRRFKDSIKKHKTDSPTFAEDFADLGRSASMVPGKVATGMIGLPGTVQALGADALNWAGRQGGADWKFKVPPVGSPGHLPNYEDVANRNRELTGKLFGEENATDFGATGEGRTPVGRAMDFVGPFVGGGLLGAAGKLNRLRKAGEVLSGPEKASKVIRTVGATGVLPAAATAIPHYAIDADNPDKEAAEILTSLFSTGRRGMFKPRDAGKVAAANAAAGRAKSFQEFGVKPTLGDITGDQTQQAAETTMLRGGKGAPSQVIMEKGQTQKIAQIDAAKEGMFGGDPAPGDAGEAAMSAVRSKAGAAKAEAKAGYEKAFADDTGGFDQEATADVGNYVRKSMDDSGLSRSPDSRLHPGATAALKDLKRFADGLAPEEAADIVDLGPDMGPVKIPKFLQTEKTTPVTPDTSLERIDIVRKRIKSYRGNNDADNHMVDAVLRGFDNWFNDAVDTKLYSGDPEAIAALKTARPAWKTYKEITAAKPGDAAGAQIAKMATKDITGEQAANWMMGSAALGGLEGTVYQVAKRMKTILGDTSPEWKGIRQAAWMNVVRKAEGKTPMGPQAVSERIYEFTNGKGRALAKELYTPEEIATMQRFAFMLKTQVPKPGAVNHSNTAYTASRNSWIRRSMPTAAAIVGFLGTEAGMHELGIFGLGVTEAVAAAAGYSARKLGQRLESGKAYKALNPNIKKLTTPPPTRKELWSGATPAMATDIGVLGGQRRPPRRVPGLTSLPQPAWAGVRG